MLGSPHPRKPQEWDFKKPGEIHSPEKSNETTLRGQKQSLKVPGNGPNLYNKNQGTIIWEILRDLVRTVDLWHSSHNQFSPLSLILLLWKSWGRGESLQEDQPLFKQNKIKHPVLRNVNNNSNETGKHSRKANMKTGQRFQHWWIGINKRQSWDPRNKSLADSKSFALFLWGGGTFCWGHSQQCSGVTLGSMFRN